MRIDVSFVLLVVATGLFALTATRLAKGWMLPVGLACFSAAFWIERLLK